MTHACLFFLRCLPLALTLALSFPHPTALGASQPAAEFKSAVPIWPAGRELDKNLTVGFRATFTAPSQREIKARIAASTLYRAYLNGVFLQHGPARGPHGFYRVDELDLRGKLRPGLNLLAIEVVGYNVNSYYVLDQPAFLQAEVVSGNRVLAYTAPTLGGFAAILLPERVQKVQRYSFQRPFSEVYQLRPGFDQWRTDAATSPTPTACAQQPAKSLLPRRVSLAEFALRPPVNRVAEGDLKTGVPISNPWKDRSLTAIGPQLGGYPENELSSIPSLEFQTIANAATRKLGSAYEKKSELRLNPKSFQIVDFGVNLTGFIGWQVSAHDHCQLAVAFDEILTGDDVDFKRLGCVNIVSVELAPGDYQFEAFEPYTMRYAKFMALDGTCTLKGIYLREYASPSNPDAQFLASDERLNRLFQAARETYRQNAVDIFMDCPSRERAGWLCDSFFTARVAKDLTGNTLIEKNFLENFQLPPRFAHLPDGMLPMCYPADHNDGIFIPNWALWFVVELEEYLARSGDRALVNNLQPRIAKLFAYFQGFRNSDGLLEKLPSWVFVEWSKANDFVQDVNYPSNMLLARALIAAGRLYGRPDWIQDAERVQAIIRQQSFDGEFFVDNARRQDGKLLVTRNRSEVCQYFAFFFETATPQSHPQLWQKLVKDFGPNRKKSGAFPEVHPANAFVGNVLRLELLSRAGLCQQLLDESIAYQLYMADLTGTLWENDGSYASCNHGFASHGGVRVLYRDVLGLASVDTIKKHIAVRFTELNLDRCQGSLPTPEGKVALRWHRENGKLHYSLSRPAGYTEHVENLTRSRLVKEKWTASH
jgi:alpha-L-rhamnosidase